MKKFLILSLSLMVIFISGCVTSPSQSSEEVEKSIEETRLKFGEIMTIDGVSVPADEYVYFYKWSKDFLDESFGLEEEMWNDEQSTELKEILSSETERQLKYKFAVHKLAKSLDIELSKEDLKKIQDEKAEMTDSIGGQDVFNDVAIQSSLSNELFDELQATTILIEKISHIEMEKEDENGDSVAKSAKKIFDEGYLKAKHILIEYASETPEEGVTDENYKIAEEVLEKLNNGEDFDKLLKEYGKDPGMESSPDGYIFKEGDMVDEFYQGTLDTKVNEISPIIESSFGFHIINRLPLTDDDYAKYEHEILHSMVDEKIYDLIVEVIDELQVEYKEGFEKLTFESIFNQSSNEN